MRSVHYVLVLGCLAGFIGCAGKKSFVQVVPDPESAPARVATTPPPAAPVSAPVPPPPAPVVAAPSPAPKPAPDVEEKGVIHLADDFSLLIIDPSLAEKIRVTRSAYTLNAGVGARFKNISQAPLVLQARTLFKSPSGVTLGDSGISNLNLAPGQEWVYYAKAQNVSGTRALLCLTTAAHPGSR